MWCSIVKRVYPLVHELLKIIKKWNILVNNNSHKHFWNGFVNIKSNILVEHDAIPEIAKCILDIHSNEGHTVLLGVEDFFSRTSSICLHGGNKTDSTSPSCELLIYRFGTSNPRITTCPSVTSSR